MPDLLGDFGREGDGRRYLTLWETLGGREMSNPLGGREMINPSGGR